MARVGEIREEVSWVRWGLGAGLVVIHPPLASSFHL